MFNQNFMKNLILYNISEENYDKNIKLMEIYILQRLIKQNIVSKKKVKNKSIN